MFVEKFLPIIEKNCKPYLDDLIKVRDSMPSKKLTESDVLYRGFKPRYYME